MSINSPAEKQINKPDNAAVSITRQKLWTLNFLLICLSNVSIYMVFYGMQPTLPIYIQDMGGSKSIAGLAFALLTFAAVVSRPFTGWALDNYGRKTILAAGILLFLMPTLLFTLMVGIIPLLILRFVQGIGWGIANTSQGTVASDIIPQENFGKGLGIYGMTSSIGMAAAPAMSLWIIDNLSFEALFITLSIFTIMSLAFAMNIKYPQLTTSRKRTKLVFFEKQAVVPSLVAFLVFIAYSSIPNFLALYMRQIGLSTAGIFFTVAALSSLACRPVTGAIIDKKGRLGYDIVALSGLITMILSMIFLPAISSTWLLIIVGIGFGLSIGTLQPSMLALTISMVPVERRGAANATFWTAVDIGIAFGSVLSGIIANFFGYEVMFYLNSVPLIIGLFIYLFNRRHMPAKV